MLAVGDLKRCARCGEEKSLDSFYRNRSKPDGLGIYCKPCYREWASRPEQRAKANTRNRPLKRAYYAAAKASSPEFLANERERSRRYRRNAGEHYRVYLRERYRRLYAPGAPRARPKKPSLWRPTAEQAARYREGRIRWKRRAYADPVKRADNLLYSRRDDVRERRNQRYHERMQDPEYVMKRREYTRQRRKNDPEFAKREDARILVNIMIRHGWMTRGACIDCGATEKIEAHHVDYDRPLEVMWLCRSDHMKRHREEFAVTTASSARA